MYSERGLSKLTVFGFGLGHVCNDICASMWFTYLLLFFQKVSINQLLEDCLCSKCPWSCSCNISSHHFLWKVLGVSRSDSAVLMLVGQFADGISTTILGLVADKIGQFKILRYIIFHIIADNFLCQTNPCHIPENMARERVCIYLVLCVYLSPFPSSSFLL